MLTAALAALGVLFLLSRRRELPSGGGGEEKDVGGLTVAEREALIQEKAPHDMLGLVDASKFGDAQLDTSGKAVSLIGAGVTGVAALAAGGPVALAAGALSLGGGVTGYLITHDTAGAITGAIFPVHGNVANAGRMAGMELDKALGGSGVSATGIVAQAAGGVALVLLMFAGTLVAVAFAIFAAILYPIVAAIEDLSRLGYGQAGALKDYNKLWNECFKRATEAFKATFPEKFVATADNKRPLTESDVTRLFTHFIDGYLHRKNRIGYAVWMAMPRGLTFQGDYEHGRFGADRGYFVGGIKPDGSLDESSVPLFSNAPEFAHVIPPEERIVNVVPAKTVQTGLFKVQVPGYTNVTDTQGRLFFEAGEWYANAVAWVEHMAGNWGVGQSELSHANFGRKQGRFEGELVKGKFDMEVWRGRELEKISQPSDTAVRLTWRGKTAYWRNSKGEAALSISYVPVPELAAATEAARKGYVPPAALPVRTLNQAPKSGFDFSSLSSLYGGK